ncbi:CRISPR-associated helicase Cas3' [Hanamia caeni]|uniref:CRISPR-associated helicase Cas3 n=1 Tax=Hanamia caeni TaxID=2294116 RepID=A0A3M9NFZ4_9BACT|nr:CRISPR-associated helicase Cas3' [Hanamia caeni]RNI36712.1 CRISPR-associated helicase Cas3' [Hanamia caeni]
MADVGQLKSHPDKLLFTHVDGVIINTQKLTKNLTVSKLAELAAIFHDLGKINPFFQDRLNQRNNGYSHHAYLSAFAFYAAFRCNKNNFDWLKKWLGVQILTENELIALLIIIAKHHGHLPDFIPKANLETEPYILNKDEIKELYTFLSKKANGLPSEEYTKRFEDFKQITSFKQLLNDDKVQNHFLDKIIFNPKHTKEYLDFFLNTQFAFASLIQADKADAMNAKTIDEDKNKIESFCKIYPETLKKYISKFQPNSELNKLRTEIREESIKNIQGLLQKDKRVFELTAPTGSGKTIMLLSLASEIIQTKANYRIMYALPFLSITEQVEKEVLDIFKEYRQENYIQRIDSKSGNQLFDKIQELLDANPSSENIKELDFLAFQEQVFAYPFVITTFVRFFETLLSNHNATLLKLPNFSKSIFLLDEIQSLPPRLYTFFVAYLTKFCEKFDCYAIISTATQPNFELPQEDKIKNFFPDYEKPASLLEHQKYFESNVFNRYQIDYWKEPINIQQLTEKIIAENNSVLVILNTIDDSKDLFKDLSECFTANELYLLNTHFTPNDRKKKLEIIKERLEKNQKTILISTQLIEAGVDIDFPVLYRDFALVSSIVQSAGRCNRNGRLENIGKVVLFNLVKDGKSRANLIYGSGKDKDILTFTKNALGLETAFEEKELLRVQKAFFDKIATELHFAKHSQKAFNLELDFLEDIKECAYAKIGKFQLIDEQTYGEQRQYYVPINKDDINFETLLDLNMEVQSKIQSQQKDWAAIKILNLKMQTLLKKMSNHIVSVRLRNKDIAPVLGHNEKYNELFKLSIDAYDSDKGVKISGEDFLI